MHLTPRDQKLYKHIRSKWLKERQILLSVRHGAQKWLFSLLQNVSCALKMKQNIVILSDSCEVWKKIYLFNLAQLLIEINQKTGCMGSNDSHLNKVAIFLSFKRRNEELVQLSQTTNLEHLNYQYIQNILARDHQEETCKMAGRFPCINPSIILKIWHFSL